MAMCMVDIMERGKLMVMDMVDTLVDITEREKLMVMDTDMVDTMVDMVMVKDQLLKKTLQTTYLPLLRDICGIWRTFMSRNGTEEVMERRLVWGWGPVGYRLENIWRF